MLVQSILFDTTRLNLLLNLNIWVYKVEVFNLLIDVLLVDGSQRVLKIVLSLVQDGF